MPTPPLSDEILQRTADLFKQYGSQTIAAQAGGVSRSTFRDRLREAAKKGLLGTAPVLPGFRLSQTTAVYDKNGDLCREFVQQKPDTAGPQEFPIGHVLKGVSRLTDGHGNVVLEWQKTREGELDTKAIVEWVKEAFSDYAPAVDPVPSPSAPAADLLTLIPLADWHLGMFAWGRETDTNWDLKIAEQTIGAAIDDLICRTPSSAEAVVLGGGDLIHSDNNANQTAKSGNVLQVDGRYQKVIMTACRLVERTVERARRSHEHVTVRLLPGNHDEHACVAVAYHLLALYRNEPRVTVDVDPSMFWWHRWGKVLLGATHGHEAKIAQMPQIMAHRRAEDWGATKFRYVHGFHLHHTAKFATEGGGCISEIHQAPIPQDAWHYGSGFLSGRSMQTIVYHTEFGEVSRNRVAILDAKNEAA